jgi:hypothetical protein
MNQLQFTVKGKLTKYKLMFGLFLNLNLVKFPMTSTSAGEWVQQLTATDSKRSCAGRKIFGFMIHISSLVITI